MSSRGNDMSIYVYTYIVVANVCSIYIYRSIRYIYTHETHTYAEFACIYIYIYREHIHI